MPVPATTRLLPQFIREFALQVLRLPSPTFTITAILAPTRSILSFWGSSACPCPEPL